VLAAAPRRRRPARGREGRAHEPRLTDSHRDQARR
jgi:hypothetical protein